MQIQSSAKTIQNLTWAHILPLQSLSKRLKDNITRSNPRPWTIVFAAIPWVIWLISSLQRVISNNIWHVWCATQNLCLKSTKGLSTKSPGNKLDITGYIQHSAQHEALLSTCMPLHVCNQAQVPYKYSRPVYAHHEINDNDYQALQM